MYAYKVRNLSVICHLVQRKLLSLTTKSVVTLLTYLPSMHLILVLMEVLIKVLLRSRIRSGICMCTSTYFFYPWIFAFNRTFVYIFLLNLSRTEILSIIDDIDNRDLFFFMIFTIKFSQFCRHFTISKYIVYHNHRFSKHWVVSGSDWNKISRDFSRWRDFFFSRKQNFPRFIFKFLGKDSGGVDRMLIPSSGIPL